MTDVDPQQKRQVRVPGLAEELSVDQSKHETHTTENVPPFLSTTECLVTERHNADPYFLRSTFYVLPHSEYSLECTGLPLALVASPFADRGSYAEVPGLDRCVHCRTYFCTFTRCTDGAYFCHICDKKSEAPIAQQGNLRYSTMEMLAASQPTRPRPVFVFALDFTFPWYTAVLDSIVDICQDEDFAFLYENVAFVLLNRGVTMFTSEPKFCTVRMPGPDIPTVSSKMVVKTTDIESVRKIITVAKRERVDLRETNTDSFISIIKDLAVAYSGVKVAWLSSAKHATFDYEKFISEVKNASINIFTSVDMAQPNNLHTLSFYTSGAVFFYSSSSVKSCPVDLRRVCTARTAFNLSLVLKVSDSLVKTGVIAPILEENYSITRLNAVDSHSSVTFQLSLSGLSKKTKFCQLQVNFVDFDGQAKLRVFNHSFTTGTPAQFFAALSPDTIFAVMCKLYVAENYALEEALVKSLIFYREKCSAANGPTQFVLPDTTKMLPVLIQGFFKNIQLPLHGMSWKSRTVSAGVESCLRIVYPRLFSLSEYTTLSKTPCLTLSMANINDLDVYVMEDSISIIVYIGHSADQQLLAQLFDAEGEGILPATASEEAGVLNAAITEIREHYNRPMDVHVIRAGRPTETAFIRRMIEDEIDGQCDYIDYIFKLHFKVQRL